MKLIVGSDERTHMTDALVEDLRQRGHDVELVGPLADEALQWPEVGRAVGEAVARGRADQGIVCCWTGTGVSIAANKVPGIRAALCTDAETARGAGTTPMFSRLVCASPARSSPAKSSMPGSALPKKLETMPPALPA